MGYNFENRLGLNDTSKTLNQLLPVLNPYLFNITQVNCAFGSSFALSSQGKVFSWGTNNDALIPTVPYQKNVGWPYELPLSKVKIISVSATRIGLSNECNSTHAGPNCEDPVCFGFVATSYQTCSSNGICIAPDTCQCYEAAFGMQCENAIYEWFATATSKWSSPNWYVNRQGGLFQSSPPPISTSAAYFQSSGVFNITIDVPSVKLSLLSIHPGASIIWTLENTVAEFDRFAWSPNSLIIMKSSTLILILEHVITTSMDLEDSVLGGLIRIEKGALLIVTKSSFNGLTLKNYGSMKIYGSMLSKNSVIENYGSIEVVGLGEEFVSRSSFSSGVVFQNFGTMTFSGEHSIAFNSKLVNSQIIFVRNAANVTFTSNFTQSRSGSIQTDNSTIIFLEPTIIDGGSVTFSGKVICEDLTFSSSDG